MSRLVTVICRHNQARSVLAAAALSRFFPYLQVASAGIAAVEGQRIPESIFHLADTWGLEVSDTVSHSIAGSQESILASDLVVVAEDEFIQPILDLGVLPQRILSMQDERFDHSLIPFDPIGQGSQVVSVELSKAIMTTVRLVRAKNPNILESVDLIITLDEANFEKDLRQGWSDAVASKGVLLVTDFRAPNFQAVSQVCDRVLELQVSRIDHQISFSDGLGEGALGRALSSDKAFAVSARFEMDQVEKFILSPQFIAFMATVAARRSVTILTEPIGLGPCAFLMASYANI